MSHFDDPINTFNQYDPLDQGDAIPSFSRKEDPEESEIRQILRRAAEAQEKAAAAAAKTPRMRAKEIYDAEMKGRYGLTEKSGKAKKIFAHIADSILGFGAAIRNEPGTKKGAYQKALEEYKVETAANSKTEAANLTFAANQAKKQLAESKADKAYELALRKQQALEDQNKIKNEQMRKNYALAVRNADSVEKLREINAEYMLLKSENQSLENQSFGVAPDVRNAMRLNNLPDEERNRVLSVLGLKNAFSAAGTAMGQGPRTTTSTGTQFLPGGTDPITNRQMFVPTDRQSTSVSQPNPNPAIAGQIAAAGAGQPTFAPPQGAPAAGQPTAGPSDAEIEELVRTGPSARPGQRNPASFGPQVTEAPKPATAYDNSINATAKAAERRLLTMPGNTPAMQKELSATSDLAKSYAAILSPMLDLSVTPDAAGKDFGINRVVGPGSNIKGAVDRLRGKNQTANIDLQQNLLRGVAAYVRSETGASRAISEYKLLAALFPKLQNEWNILTPSEARRGAMLLHFVNGAELWRRSQGIVSPQDPRYKDFSDPIRKQVDRVEALTEQLQREVRAGRRTPDEAKRLLKDATDFRKFFTDEYTREIPTVRLQVK